MPVRSLLDPRVVTEALERRGRADAGSERLRLDRAWPLNGSGISVLFRGSGSERGLESAWCVLRPPAGRSGRTLSGKLAAGRALELPAQGAWALQLAEDPELANLWRMLDPERARRRLASLAPELWDGRRRWQARVRRYKPLRRCVVEYRTGSGGGRRSLFFKRYRRTDLGATVRVYRALGRAGGEASDAALPCALCKSWSALVWEGLPGELLSRRLGRPGSSRAVAEAGAALGRLHSSPVHFSRVHGRAEELVTLAAWNRIVPFVDPALARHLEPALSALLTASTGLGRQRLVPSHRDFHDGQVLLRKGGAVLLDFDTAARAEPELDAGNFLAHLDLFALRRPAATIAGAAEAFVSAYEEAARRSLRAEILSWYRAAALVRLASVYRFRPAGRSLAPALLAGAAELARPVGREVI